MEKNNKKNKKLIIISIISIVALIGLIIGSYAYFSSKSEQTRTVQADQVDIHFSDESAEIKLEKAELINSDEVFDKAAKKEFTITNNGTSAARVSLMISDIEFDSDRKLATNDLKWELYQNGNKIESGDFFNLDGDSILMHNVSIDLKSTTDKYTLYFYLLNSTTKDQNYLQGGTFKAKITINGTLREKKTYNTKLLSGKIISNSIDPILRIEDKPDFNKIATTDDGMFIDKDNDGDTYYFRGAVTDNYVAIDGVKEYGSDSVCTGGKSKNSPTKLGSYSSAVSSCNNGFYLYAGYETPDACVEDLDCLVYTVGTSTNKISKIGTYYDAYNACNNSYSNYGYSSSNECLSDLVSEDSYFKNKLWRVIRINGDKTTSFISILGSSPSPIPVNAGPGGGFSYRIVINLNDDTPYKSGDGTIDNPYLVSLTN